MIIIYRSRYFFFENWEFFNKKLEGENRESNRIFINQKRLIRLIFNLSPRESCKGVFIKILTVPCIYVYKCLLHARNNINTFCPLSHNHNYQTRSRDTLLIPRHRTANFSKSLLYNAVVLYNKLPADLRSLNLTQFKSNIRKILTSNAFYSVNEFMTHFWNVLDLINVCSYFNLFIYCFLLWSFAVLIVLMVFVFCILIICIACILIVVSF